MGKFDRHSDEKSKNVMSFEKKCQSWLACCFDERELLFAISGSPVKLQVTFLILKILTVS